MNGSATLQQEISPRRSRKARGRRLPVRAPRDDKKIFRVGKGIGQRARSRLTKSSHGRSRRSATRVTA